MMNYMMEPIHVRNKRVLVTGGGTGIGFGIASVFVKNGARVIITGRREDVLRKATQELGDHCAYMVNDISRKDKIPELVEDVEQQHGPVDVLVNNAGISLKKNMSEMTDAEFENVLNTNLISVFSLSREMANRMKDRGKGSIILISSMAAFLAIEKVTAYAVAKTGLVGLMRSMVSEYARYGLRINTIAPGWIETPMLMRAFEGDEPRKQKALKKIPVHHLGVPEDVGQAALFLASDAASYVNGVHLPVDGGALYNF